MNPLTDDEIKVIRLEIARARELFQDDTFPDAAPIRKFIESVESILDDYYINQDVSSASSTHLNELAFLKGFYEQALKRQSPSPCEPNPATKDVL